MRSLISRCLAGFVLVWFLVPVFSQESRSWNDKTGKFSVTAVATEFDGKEVALLKNDGKLLRLPLEKLSEDDQKHLRGKGRFKIQLDTISSVTGETPGALLGKTARSLDLDTLRIITETDSPWAYRPFAASSVSLKNADKISFMANETPDDELSWSDLFFCAPKPSRVLVCHYVMTMPTDGSAENSGVSFSQIFSAEIETKKNTSAEFPDGFRILDVSPDGTRLLLLEDATFKTYSRPTRVHTVRLSENLELTHQTCFEPFVLPGVGAPELAARIVSATGALDTPGHSASNPSSTTPPLRKYPEGMSEEVRKRLEEAEKRHEESRRKFDEEWQKENAEIDTAIREQLAMGMQMRQSLNAAMNHGKRKTDTPDISLTVDENYKDPLGRTLSPTKKSFFESDVAVARGIWLDNGSVLLQSQGNCLIALDVDSGKTTWSFPLGETQGPLFFSPDKRFCLVAKTVKPLPSPSAAEGDKGDNEPKIVQMTTHTVGGKMVIVTVDSTGKKSIQADDTDKLTARTAAKVEAAEATVFEGPFLIVDTKEGRLAGKLESEVAVKCFDFSPDGKTLAALGENNSLLRWNLSDGQPLEPIHFSLPLVREKFSRDLTGDLQEIVSGNQQIPYSVRWADNRYVKVGATLIDTETEMPVWQYDCDAEGFQKSFGGYFWFEPTWAERKLDIVALKIPPPRPPAVKTTPYLVKPGTEVAVRIDETILKDREEIKGILEKKITDNGWVVRPEAEYTVVARIRTDPVRTLYAGYSPYVLSYQSKSEDGRKLSKIASFAPPRYEVGIVKGKELIWYACLVPTLPIVAPEDAKSNQAPAKIKAGFAQSNYTSWFTELMIPKKIRKETTLGKTDVR